jgi:YVTN family beta-propeller protein
MECLQLLMLADSPSFPVDSVELGRSHESRPRRSKILWVVIGLAVAAPVSQAFLVTATLMTGQAPIVVTLNPVTNRAYVANVTDGTVTVVDGGSAQVVATVTVGATPEAVAVDTLRNKIYVANNGSNNVTVIDGATNLVSSTIPVGSEPFSVAVNPATNKIYVTNSLDGTLSVIDGATATVTATPSVGTGPSGVAVNPVTNKVYVANNSSNNVSVIDGATNLVSSTVMVGSQPFPIAVNPATNQIYVANTGDSTVSVIDGATATVIATPTVGAEPLSLAVNPVTNLIYVANFTDGTVTIIDGSTNVDLGAPVTVGATPFAVTLNASTNLIYIANNATSNVSVIDGASGSVTATVPAGSGPVAIAVNPATNKIFVTNENDNTVSVIDGSSNAVVTVPVGATPKTVAVNPISNKVYVANTAGTTVTLIDGTTNAPTPITVGTSPQAVAVNALTNKIYVANNGSANVTVIDGSTNATSTVNVGTNPTQIALNPITDKIYVANAGGNSVTVIDGASNATSTINLGFAPFAVAVNSTTDKVYVADSADNGVLVIDGATNSPILTVPVGANPQAFALDAATGKVYVMNTGASSVTVIDGITNAAMNVNTAPQQSGIAVNSLTNTIYVSSKSLGSVTVINGANLATATVTVGSQPTGVDVDPANNRIFVANSAGGNVTVIDGATNTTVSVPAGTTPTGVAVNPVTGKVYVTNSGSANTTVISEQTLQTIPLTASITPLSGNATPSGTPTFDFAAASTFSPSATIPEGVFFQADSWQGPWTQATVAGSSLNGTLASLVPGFHVIYAYAVDGQDSTSTELDSALIGNLSAYGFFVTAPNAHFSVSLPSSVTAGSAFSVVVAALDAYGNPLTTYSGTVHISSSDAAATLPADATLTAGVGTFTFTFNTAGPETISANDTVTPLVAGTSPTINVQPVGPSILGSPAAETVNTGANAAFWATAAGTQPLTYQWKLNGAAIAGATSPLLFLTNLKAANAGSYTVTITNAEGSVTSAPAALTVGTGSTPNQFAFTQQPMSQTIVSGTTVVFSAQSGANSYQWFCNGQVIGGATDSIYVNSDPEPGNDGTYTCVAIDSAGAVMSAGATLNVVSSADPGRLINLSSRAAVASGANELIVGYVVGGLGTSGTDTQLIRASGPALAQFGLAGVLADPNLTLNGTSGVIATNAGWAGNAQVSAAAAAVGAFSWPTAGSHDAALLETLAKGAYTAGVAPAGSDSGIALAEIYDTTPAASYTPLSPRLVNISARAQVGTGGNILIAGFIVGGTTSETVLIRASGPALKTFGVPGVLPDPLLKLYRSNADGSSVLLQSNANWGGDTHISGEAAAVGAFSWGNIATPDSALLVTLPPGAYTAEVSGNDADSGVALAEIYEVP